MVSSCIVFPRSTNGIKGSEGGHLLVSCGTAVVAVGGGTVGVAAVATVVVGGATGATGVTGAVASADFSVGVVAGLTLYIAYGACILSLSPSFTVIISPVLSSLWSNTYFVYSLLYVAGGAFGPGKRALGVLISK